MAKKEEKTPVKAEIKTPTPPAKVGMGDVMKAIQESKDARELAYTMLVNNMWDRSKLKMIARIDAEFTFYIVRNLIIVGFYAKYWSRARATIKLLKTKEFPFFIRDVQYVAPIKPYSYDGEYEKLILDILELSISRDGKGRSEILELIGASERNASLMDKVKSGVNQMMQ